ncbi:MAG: C1 family peptidase [Ginsengibacter sp.]
MKSCIQFMLCLLYTTAVCAQQNNFTPVKINSATTVKDQFSSSTCWDFACTAMTESELLKTGNSELDLSETFTMFNTYIDKAAKYLQCRDRKYFTQGGIGEDMLKTIDNYGAMPQEIYPGIHQDTIMNKEAVMYPILKSYLDSILVNNPDTIPANWKNNFVKILEHYMGTPSENFMYNGKCYTAKTFAAEYIKSSSSDFIGLTSFTHHPYYSPFVIEVSHNYNNNVYNNLPLDEFITTVKSCIENGYTLIWDTDISNEGFQKNKGFAMWANGKNDTKALPDFEEKPYTNEIRQQLFKKGTTQNDHLMQITGLVKNAAGKEYFVVKNSWGNLGPFNGYIYVSIPYFAINTISILVNKKALPQEVAIKLDLKNDLHQTEVMNKFAASGHESSSMTVESSK